MRAGSVVLIMNRFINPSTKVLENLCISTEIRSVENEKSSLETDEPDLSNFDPASTSLARLIKKHKNETDGALSQEQILAEMFETRSIDGSSLIATLTE